MSLRVFAALTSRTPNLSTSARTSRRVLHQVPPLRSRNVTAQMRTLRVIGPGRAGRSLASALERVGWVVHPLLGRADDVTDAGRDVDLLVIATPDGSIADVAAAVATRPDTVIAHLAGSLGLDVLGRHPCRAAVHPLVALPGAEVGARRLAGASFAVAGAPAEALATVEQLVRDLGGRSFVVADEDRATYHAAAVIASNHLVALLGQVDRVAAAAGLPLAAYLDLVRVTVENVAELGPAGALTGPVARGDEATLDRHRAALARIGADEVATYDAMVTAARRLRE
jgi:predicted short-subunit dehydrogenase-like oxidoreductase (DUF2520 family)